MVAVDGPGAEHEQLAAWWTDWAQHRDARARTSLFFHYGGWIRILTARLLAVYPHPLAEWGDYIHFASLGLLQALERFEPERGVRFQTFAEPFIKGAVLKGLSCYVQDARSRHPDRSNQVAYDEEASFEVLVNAAVDLAFGFFLEMGIAEPMMQEGPQDIYARAANRNLLQDYVSALPPRERQIIEGHYYQQLDFAVLGELMGISRARVSQLHRQALQRIRAGYEQADDLDLKW
ncbi:RNA polymerase sigma-28 (SigD/FliA/WhiG) subunit [Fluviicoccus keumensis]|uniref:RNA polymerase sigma-28 (SigD/FliA/WhiG) subunit n=1 Tax=Fluviicoccus keumensis TaxID=1435465 RepID=A0A4Q7YNS5_9GAMM|nr:sigma-70 family RNA polymerase sigma factor [Fluviicoccus keumensis]RZU38491.1 RNA polymerase sigma-28 (SigD/FliA/WhiG) subunit [Fluviicoccus keumensis]